MIDRDGLNVVGEGGVGIKVPQLDDDFAPGQELYVEGVTDNAGGPVVCQGQFCAWVEPKKIARVVFVHLSVADYTKFVDVPIERLKPVPPEIAENRRLAYEHNLPLNPDGTIAWSFSLVAMNLAQVHAYKRGDEADEFRLKLCAQALEDAANNWFIDNPGKMRR